MPETPLDQLIKRLARLPGLGPRSARRTALFLLKNRDQMMLPLAAEMDHVGRNVRACVECGNLDMQDKCSLCLDGRRDQSRRGCRGAHRGADTVAVHPTRRDGGRRVRRGADRGFAKERRVGARGTLGSTRVRR